MRFKTMYEFRKSTLLMNISGSYMIAKCIYYLAYTSWTIEINHTCFRTWACKWKWSITWTFLNSKVETRVRKCAQRMKNSLILATFQLFQHYKLVYRRSEVSLKWLNWNHLASDLKRRTFFPFKTYVSLPNKTQKIWE